MLHVKFTSYNHLKGRLTRALESGDCLLDFIKPINIVKLVLFLSLDNHLFFSKKISLYLFYSSDWAVLRNILSFSKIVYLCNLQLI